MNEKLRHIQVSAFNDVVQYGQKHNVNNRIGAYMLAIDRVAFSMKLRASTRKPRAEAVDRSELKKGRGNDQGRARQPQVTIGGPASGDSAFVDHREPVGIGQRQRLVGELLD